MFKLEASITLMNMLIGTRPQPGMVVLEGSTPLIHDFRYGGVGVRITNRLKSHLSDIATYSHVQPHTTTYSHIQPIGTSLPERNKKDQKETKCPAPKTQGSTLLRPLHFVPAICGIYSHLQPDLRAGGERLCFNQCFVGVSVAQLPGVLCEVVSMVGQSEREELLVEFVKRELMDLRRQALALVCCWWLFLDRESSSINH